MLIIIKKVANNINYGLKFYLCCFLTYIQQYINNSNNFFDICLKYFDNLIYLNINYNKCRLYLKYTYFYKEICYT